MPTFAICNETFAPLGSADGWSWDRICAFLSETGYDGVEIAPFTFAGDVRTIDSASRREIARVAADAGLSIVGLHWLLVSPPGMHFHSRDSAQRLATRDYLRALIEFAGEIGAPTLVLGSPKARGLQDGDRDGAWGRAADIFQSLLTDLVVHGVTLCPEALPAAETDFWNTMAETTAFCCAIDHPNVRPMLDVKSLCSEDESPAATILRYGLDAAHVHANDANRRGPGAGDTDYVPIVAALGEIGYDGVVSVEVFDYSQGPETIAIESLRYLKEVWRR